MAVDGTPRITWHGKVFAVAVEIVKLGEIEVAVQVPDLPDPWVRRFIATLVAWERIEGASRLWLQQGGTIESWRRYETELGVTKSKTRQPRSVIQPFVKWARGGRNDTDGSLHRASAAFDAWLALGSQRPDPTPRNGEPGTSELAEWLRDKHGCQAVADAYENRLEYVAALKRGTTPYGSRGGCASTVWVTHADGTERV